jgi:hypothetical protein
MSQLFQPGQHLDADQLNAFVEHALPDHERLETVGHLSECSHCRQIVFLAQQAQPQVASMSDAAPAWRRWFTPTPLLVAGSAAFACVLIVAVSLRLRHVSQSPAVTTAAMTELPAASVGVERREEVATAPAATASPSRLPAKVPLEAKTALAAPLDQAPVVTVDGAGKGTTSQTIWRQAPSVQRGGAAGHGAAAYGAGTGGAVGGTEQLSQGLHYQSQQRAAVAQDSVSAAPAPPDQIANSSREASVAAAPLQGRSTTETVEVSSAAAPIQTEPVTTNSMIPLRMAARRSPAAALPSNLPSVATISNGRQMLAADSIGGVFVSVDGGRHWKPVVQQWPGKAVQLGLVRPVPAAPASEDASAVSGANASGTAAALSTFQLITDSGAAWISQDGTIWKPR